MQFINKIQDFYIKHLFRLVAASMKRPAMTLAIGMIAAFASLGYSVFNLPINSDQEHLVSRENEFLKREEMLSKAFPQQDHTILVLVSGDDPWKVSQSAERLADVLRQRSDLFKHVFHPQSTEFFQKNGLLYLETDDLAEFVDGLAAAQPAIAELAADPNLRGLFNLLETGLTAEDDGQTPPENFERIINRIAIAVEEFNAARAPPDIWQDAFPDWLNETDEEYPDALQVVIVQPHLDYESFLSGKKPIDGIRQIASDLRLSDDGVKVRLTGREPLTLDELASILFNIETAGLLSVLAIICVLGLGVRSWRLIAMIMVTLFIGISLSFGWAAISVGELNMISAAFAVLFLGISVDFSIHIALRYREELRKISGRDPLEAMRTTIHSAGGAVSLCGLATAIGFLSFVPTDYFALRDLGIIAGGSMLLALLASFTVLPALLNYLPLKDVMPSDEKTKDRNMDDPNIIGRFSVSLYAWIREHFRPITISAFVLALAALPLALQMGFDHSALVIKDPSSESVISFKELQARGLYTSYTAIVLTPDRRAAVMRAKELDALPLVRKVETHEIYVPKAQEEKTEILSEAAFFMAPAFSAELKRSPSPQDFEDSAKNLFRVIRAKRQRDGSLSAAQQKLGAALAALLRSSDPRAKMNQLNKALTGDFIERITRLERSLEAEAFSFDDLPDNIRSEVQAADGRIKLTVYPTEDMADPDALVRFVKEITKAESQAGGRPLVEYAVGQLTVDAFRTSLMLAVIAITLILLASLRSIKNTLLVLAPILLAGTYTLAVCVWLGISFNFVNVLLLPLLLGLGVANGIHILARASAEKNVREVMHSSTPIAVFLSNTTTLVTFGALSVATHRGMSSMGITLTIAMIFMILCALVVLPAMLSWMRAQDAEVIEPALKTDA